MYQGPTYQDKDSYKKHNTALPFWLPETAKYMKSNLVSHLTNKMSTIFIAVKTTNKPRIEELWKKYLTAACVFFLYNKPTRCTNLSNFIFGMELYTFRTVPFQK